MIYFMRIKHVYFSSYFKKKLSKYSPKEKEIIKERIKLFSDNPFSPQLKTHKLKGNLKHFWSFSISYSLRILFEFMDGESAGLVDIGTHEIYK